MNALASVQYLNVDSLIEAVRSLGKAERKPPAEAVRLLREAGVDILDLATADAAGVESAMWDGILARVYRERHWERGLGVEHSPVPDRRSDPQPIRHIAGRPGHVRQRPDFWQARYVVNGTDMERAELGHEELAVLIADTDGDIRGLRKLRRWWVAADKALIEHGVAVLGDLPEPAKKRLEGVYR